jgi:hypothetical protein
MVKTLKFNALISLLITFSCQKEIEYKGPGKDPRLVLNGVVENDSVFRLSLEKTVFFLSNESSEAKYITSGATINVTNLSTNQSYSLNQSNAGNLYEFPFVVTSDTKYKVSVVHPDYPSIESEMTTTSKVEIISVDTSTVVKDQQNFLKARITWNDPSSENYYMIRVKSKYYSANQYYEYPYYLLSNDVSVDNSQNTDIDGSVYPVSDLMFDDKKFNGQTKSIEILFNYNEPYIDPLDPATIVNDLYLITMNRETYQYYVSMKKNISMDFFSEPVKVFTNITNGFGIFGTLNYSKFSF